MKILPPPHNKGQETATGSGEIISSTGGLIQSVNILPETGKPTELHKVPGSVVTSSVRILPLSAPATSAADAGNTVALISAEGPPKPLVSSQAATFTTRSAHQRDFIRLAFCERSLIWLGDKFVSRHRGGYIIPFGSFQQLNSFRSQTKKTFCAWLTRTLLPELQTHKDIVKCIWLGAWRS